MADEQKTLIDITALKYFYKSLQNVTVLIAPSSIESASSQNLGRTYFIPADGTYAGLSCKKGDHIVSNGTTWVLIPKGTSEGGTTYYAGTGIDISKVDGKDTITNTGVTAIAEATGDANKGKINVTTNSTSVNVAVHGLGSAAYETVGTEKTDITSAGTKVPNANAVYGFVDDTIKALDVTDSAVTGKYVSAVSEADGKITVTRADLPTSLPASDVTDDYSATGKVPVSGKAVASAISGKLDTNQKGAAGGVAELDANGKVLSSQLPSYVDDVIEASSKSAFPTTGESGKIYVDTTANLTYRWTGTAYTEISPSIALGETSSTAYRGDRGKTAYDHATTTATNPHGTTKSDVGLGNVGNFKAVSTVASQGLTDTEKSNARTNIGAGTYTKASTGIPKTDLASAVQTSLGKADTALQEHQSLENYVKTTDSRLTDARASNDVQAYAKTGSGITVGVSVPSNAKFTDTTYSSKTAASGGTDVSLVTTGEKYTWNNKQNALSFMTTPSSTNKVATKTEVDAKVPTTRTVNSKALSSDITLSGADVKVTGYTKASTASVIATTDTVNAALGKVEKALDGKAASSHNQASNTITAMTGYSKGTNTGAIAATDSLNTAIAKLENGKADETELSSAIDGVNTTIAKVVIGDDSLFFTDSEEKSTKIVPENAVKGITAMIGGKSRKSKNLLSRMNELAGKTFTSNGVTFTFDSTGETVTVSGTTAANAGICNIHVSSTGFFPSESGKTYFIKGNSDNSSILYIDGYTSTWGGMVNTSTNDTTTISDLAIVRIIAKSDTTFKGEKIKPFICLNSETDKSYEPPAVLVSAPIENVVSCLENAVDGDFELGSMDGSSGVNIDSTTNIRTKNYLQVEPSTVYEFDSSGFNANLFEYNSNKNLVKTHYDINNSKFTTSSTTAYVRFRMVSAYGTTYRNNIRLVKPYNKITVPVPEAVKNLPDYGCSAGNVYNYVDFENMVYHHRIAKSKVKNMEWYAAPTSTSDKYRMGSITLKNTVKKTGSGVIDNILAYKYARVSADNTWFNKEGICVDGAGTVFVYDSKYSSSTSHTSFAADNADMEIYYELATEELIDISDILFPFLCESGGTITFENEHNIDVPNTVIYEKEVLA